VAAGGDAVYTSGVSVVVSGRAIRVGATALVMALAGMLVPDGAARAGELQRALRPERQAEPPAVPGQLDRLVKDLGLSLLHGPLGSLLAVSLGTAREIRPYASIGGSPGLGRLDDPLDPHRDLSRLGDSTELGAGLSWRLGDRLELFGEYRFLSIRPSLDDRGRSVRDPDDQLQGGLSIRF
jgi:hypothetical protein